MNSLQKRFLLSITIPLYIIIGMGLMMGGALSGDIKTANIGAGMLILLLVGGVILIYRDLGR